MFRWKQEGHFRHTRCTNSDMGPSCSQRNIYNIESALLALNWRCHICLHILVGQHNIPSLQARSQINRFCKINISLSCRFCHSYSVVYTIHPIVSCIRQHRYNIWKKKSTFSRTKINKNTAQLCHNIEKLCFACLWITLKGNSVTRTFFMPSWEIRGHSNPQMSCFMYIAISP